MDDEGDQTSSPERQERERQRREAEKRQRDFAAERSHREADGAIELGKTVCQALILVNGGALTALLAYAGAQNPILTFLPPRVVGMAILGFCFALFLALGACFMLHTTVEARSRQWDIIANRWGEDWVAEAERQEKRAIDNLQNTRIFIVLSCGIFSFVAGGLEASIWSKSKPAQTVERAAPTTSPSPMP